jgi:hypothetical protein
MRAQTNCGIAYVRSQFGSAIIVASMVLLLTAQAWSQSNSPPPASGPETAPQTLPQQDVPASPAREDNPGLLHDIGRMFDKLPSLKSPQETIEDLNARARDAAKDASDSLSRLAKPSSVASGRMVCPVSANGAPDCKVGADKLCQSKGFKEGKSLNTDAAEACSAKVLIPGRARKPDDCRTENYVTRALCQ